MTNPDLGGLFDNWSKGSLLLVTFNGSAAQGRLQSIDEGIVSLSGPDLVIFVGGGALPVDGPINIDLEDITSVSLVGNGGNNGNNGNNGNGGNGGNNG